MKTYSLKCQSCGGVLNLDDAREVMFCPYCGSKEIFEESDSVKKERIRTQAYRDIELGKQESERLINKDNKVSELNKIKWLVILFIALAIICIIAGILDI